MTRPSVLPLIIPYAAPGISKPPAKAPRLDSGLLKKHPHPMLAGDRTSGDSPP